MQQRKSSFRIEKIKKLCLAPNPEVANEILTRFEISLKRNFEVLAYLTSATSYYMEHMTQLQSNNSEKLSKPFKNIPTKYQNMILVASSVGDSLKSPITPKQLNSSNVQTTSTLK